MQFDPGMEYQPGWGDGESQLLFGNCIKTFNINNNVITLTAFGIIHEMGKSP